MNDELASVFNKMKIQWASEILDDFLYLGSGSAASKMSALEKRAIFNVLNVADDVENFFQGKDDRFVYCNLQVKDFGEDKGIGRVFDEAIQFLRTVKEKDGKVLVHCAAGRNRSPTIVIAYLMTDHEMTLKEAFDFVRAKRSLSILRDNRLQLWEYEKAIKGKTSWTEEEVMTGNV